MSPQNVRQRIGRAGEQLAAEYLSRRGYRIEAGNVRTPHGEIDLIAWKDGVTIFVEVKTRSGTGYGMPEEAVTPTKRAHLLAAAEWYWQQSDQEQGEWRIDVIAILRRVGDRRVEVEHFENAVQG